MPDLSGISIDRYHIIEPLGQGGMANVYKAYDTRLERNVAIKFIRRDAFSPDVLDMVLKRFDREAKSLAKLTHPNIVGIIDYGEHEGSPYLVMPYLQGGTLKQYLGTPMSIEKAASLLEPVADALAFAHQKGIVHRDVKPANILITEGGKPMLTDFGIARLLESGDGATLTGTGMGVGTPEYMSPEQAMGREVDGRTDIYSLGIVLFELVTGQKPYTADTPMAVVLKQTTEPLPRPSSIVPGLTDAVEQILYKSLAKDPKDRYQSMTDFKDALGKFSKWETQLPTQPAMPVVPETPAENEPTIQAELSSVRAELKASVPPLPAVDTASATEMALPKKEAPPAKMPVPVTKVSPPVKKKMPIWPFIAGGVGVIAIIAILFATNILGPKKNPPASSGQPSAAQPTNAPAGSDQGGSTSLQPVEVTLWYGYDPNNAEGKAFIKILGQAAKDLPGIKINAVPFTFTEIYAKYRTEVASGGGPDLYLVPNDSLGDDVRAGYIADITDLAAGKLQGINRLGLEGMAVDGKIYGIPESLKAIAMWYNKDLLPIPPTTTDQLKTLMESGKQVAISYGCYHYYGFFGAFGGKIFDSNWKVIADQNKGVLDTITYLNQLYQISARNGWTTSDVDGWSAFTSGKAALITNGNWAMGDYRAALGDKLAVMALPSGPGGPATPMLGVDGFFLNPNSQKKEAALQVALYLTNPASQTVMMNEAGHVPVRTDINVTDPLIKNLVAAFNKGATPRPMVPQLNLYWNNFCDPNQVFVNKVSPAAWLKTATANANK